MLNPSQSSPFFICDIDGTIANCEHRKKYLPSGKMDWQHFLNPTLVALDAPIPHMKNILNTLSGRYGIIYVSGRPEALRDATLEWLMNHHFSFNESFPFSSLYMRGNLDYRPDHIIKEEILALIRATYGEPSFVIDDRPSVLQMWQRNGLLTLALPSSEKPPMPTIRGSLTILIGPSGSGKSTYANAHYSYSRDCIILSSDRLRASMFEDPRDQTHNAEVFSMMHRLASAHLEAGAHVILDATHLRHADRLNATALAHGKPVTYILFNADPNIPWHGNLSVVRKHEHILKSQLADILAGDNLPNVTVHNLMQKDPR